MSGDCVELCQGVVSPFFGEIVIKIMHGICGNFAREVLDPAANLLFFLLKQSNVNEAESSISIVINQTCTQLGDPMRNVFISILRKCSQDIESVSSLMSLFDDIWLMYQSEDNGNGSLASGDFITKFLEKYSSS